MWVNQPTRLTGDVEGGEAVRVMDGGFDERKYRERGGKRGLVFENELREFQGISGVKRGYLGARLVFSGFCGNGQDVSLGKGTGGS